MSTNEKGVSTIAIAIAIPNVHAEASQARKQELLTMRQVIPNFIIPADAKATIRLNSAGSVPPEFIELTCVAVTNQEALVRGGAPTPAEVRDYIAYADAYDPLADELEAFAQFVRHSTAVARAKAGNASLTTYAIAQRLAKQPEHAGLRPYVADMRRALGRARKLTPEALAKLAEKTAQAAAKAAAKKQPATAPAVTTTQTS